MHNVLARQLRRLGLSPESPPAAVETWVRFLERVEGYYANADQNRYLIERSLRRSSDELMAANRELATRAEAEIAKREARYRDLFQLSRIATWEENFVGAAEALDELRSAGVTDLVAHLQEHHELLTEICTRVVVTDVNPAVGALLRTDDLDALIGPVTPDMVDDDNAEAWVAQLEAVWERLGSVRVDDLRGLRTDGTLFHGVLEWHAPRVGDRYDYRRVVVTMVDITDMVEAELRMQEVLTSKDEFLASISHELRTPLTSVLGFAELLKDMESDTIDEEWKQMLEVIVTQAADLSDIVEDLLVAARTGLGQFAVGSLPVDLHAQVAQTLEAGRDIYQRVRLSPRSSPPIRAIGDPNRVRQIIRNLVTNAMKYGGDNIEVTFDADADHAYLRVVDDGGGLDEEAAAKVFERYYRSEGEESLTGSVGIGLTIARDLARMMSGDLYYEPRIGHTVFTLQLPRYSSVVRSLDERRAASDRVEPPESTQARASGGGAGR